MKLIMITLSLCFLVITPYILYKNHILKKEQLDTYNKMVKLLEEYKPSNTTQTLKADEDFMKKVVFMLKNDKEFVETLKAK